VLWIQRFSGQAWNERCSNAFILTSTDLKRVCRKATPNCSSIRYIYLEALRRGRNHYGLEPSTEHQSRTLKDQSFKIRPRIFRRRPGLPSRTRRARTEVSFHFDSQNRHLPQGLLRRFNHPDTNDFSASSAQTSDRLFCSSEPRDRAANVDFRPMGGVPGRGGSPLSGHSSFFLTLS
jgi:hypothetical protein